MLKIWIHTLARRGPHAAAFLAWVMRLAQTFAQPQTTQAFAQTQTKVPARATIFSHRGLADDPTP